MCDIAYILNIGKIVGSSYVGDNKCSVVGITIVIVWGFGFLFFRCCEYLSVSTITVSLLGM